MEWLALAFYWFALALFVVVLVLVLVRTAFGYLRFIRFAVATLGPACRQASRRALVNAALGVGVAVAAAASLGWVLPWAWLAAAFEAWLYGVLDSVRMGF